MKNHWLLLALLGTFACGGSTEPQGATGAAGDTAAGGASAAGGQRSTDTAGEVGVADAAGAAGTPEVSVMSPLAEGPGLVAGDYASSTAYVTQMNAPRIGLASSPHRIQQIWYSSNLQPVLNTASFDAVPTGTVAIKEQSRDGDSVIDQVMVMIKLPAGTDPDRGDWVWQQLQPKTLKLVSSSETSTSFRDFCSGCHRRYASTDWLAGTMIKD